MLSSIRMNTDHLMVWPVQIAEGQPWGHAHLEATQCRRAFAYAVHLAVYEGANFSTSQQNLFFVFLILVIIVGIKCYLFVVFDFYFPNA